MSNKEREEQTKAEIYIENKIDKFTDRKTSRQEKYKKICHYEQK